VSIVTLLPLVLIVGVMFMMTRSAKNKQRQASTMRNQMEPGSGVRTIGGMYAVVKEVNEETVLLELTDGVHAHFAKNAIGAVLAEEEFNRIVHGIEPEEIETDSETEGVEDGDGDVTTDAATGDAAPKDDAEKPGEQRIDLSKTEDAPGQDGPDSTSK
jgi:preprotein translocase subunit YajC